MSAFMVYKVVHLVGVFMVLLSLGGLLVVHATGESNNARWRTLAAATNGMGLFLAFFAGFGLVARLELDWPWPLWVFMKILIWVVFGILMAMAGRLAHWARTLWWSSLALAGLAAYLANFKPG